MSKGKKAALLVLTVCLAGAAVLIWLAASELLDRHDGRAYYDDVREQTVTVEDSAAVVTAADEILPGVTDEAEADSLTTIDFAALSETMPDICGWITIPGTVIDYPVVQGADNDYYLSHLPDGTVNSCGSIMLDMHNSADWSDKISILHGHHMRAGTMFGDLQKYEDAGYADDHSVVDLYALNGHYSVRVIGACVVDGNILNETVFTNDSGQLDDLIEMLMNKSVYDPDISLKKDDRYIILSTCAYDFDDARFAVLGVFTE